MHETDTSALFLTLTWIINIITGMSCCVAFRVNINSKMQISMQIVAMPLFVSMYFRFKLDINANSTMQNGEWVFISVFFLLSTYLTPKER